MIDLDALRYGNGAPQWTAIHTDDLLAVLAELRASRRVVESVRAIIAVEWGENAKSIAGDTEFESKVRKALDEYDEATVSISFTT